MDKTVLELKSEIEDFYLNTMIDQGSFLRFLDTMAKFHKYNIEEQINIFNNASENSTALASEEIWKKLNFTIKENAIGVPIIKKDGEQERVEFVYDVSDMNEYRPNMELLWHIDEERDKEYLDANLQGEGTVENRVRNICMQMKEGFNGNEEEKNILGLSLSYVILKRMGYDTSEVLNELLTTPWELENPEELLTQVNIDAKSILNPLGNYIRNGRTNVNDRSRFNNGATQHDRGRADRGNEGLGDRGELRTMGEDQNGISDRRTDANVEGTLKSRESEAISEGLPKEVRGEVRTNIREDNGKRGRNRGIESEGFNELDSTGTTSENDSNGDNNSGNQRDGVENQTENNISNIFSFSEREISISENYSNTLYYLASPSQDFTREFLSANNDNINYFIAIREYAENFNGKIFYTAPSNGMLVFGFTNEADRNNFVNNVYSLVESVRNNVATEEKDNGESAPISEAEANNENTEEIQSEISSVSDTQNTVTEHYIRDSYSDLGDDGEIKLYYGTYADFDDDDYNIATNKLNEIHGNLGAFNKLSEISQKYSGTFVEGSASEDEGILGISHFRFDTEEDREAFIAEANTLINDTLNSIKEQEQEKEQENNIEQENLIPDLPQWNIPLDIRTRGRIIPGIVNHVVTRTYRAGENDKIDKGTILAQETLNTETGEILERTVFFDADFNEVNVENKKEYTENTEEIQNENPSVSSLSLNDFIIYDHNLFDRSFYDVELSQNIANIDSRKSLEELAKDYNGWFVEDGESGICYRFDGQREREAFLHDACEQFNIFNNKYFKIKYCYLLNARPLSPGAQPKDFIFYEEGLLNGRYGGVYYGRKLSEEEIKEYELTPSPFNDTSAVILKNSEKYNIANDKIDDIIRQFGKQEIDGFEAVNQIKNIENSNQNTFLTDRIELVSERITFLQENINNTLERYEKKEINFLETVNHLHTLKNEIFEQNNYSTLLKDNFMNVIDIYEQNLKDEREREQVEKVRIAQQKNIERIISAYEKEEITSYNAINELAELRDGLLSYPDKISEAEREVIKTIADNITNYIKRIDRDVVLGVQSEIDEKIRENQEKASAQKIEDDFLKKIMGEPKEKEKENTNDPPFSLFPENENTTDINITTETEIENNNSVQTEQNNEGESTPVSENADHSVNTDDEIQIDGTIEESNDNFTLSFTEIQNYDFNGELEYHVYPSKKVLRLINFNTLNEIAQKHSGRSNDVGFIKHQHLTFDHKEEREAFLTEVNEFIKSKEIDLSSIDYNADMSTTNGKRAVFKRNIAAIRLMKELEDEKRDATSEEAKLLQSYAGFGGLSEAFDSFNKSWSEEYHILLSELSTKEFEEARNSTLSAYYTPDNIVQSVYDGLSSIGFEKGNILEPSTGSGKFFSNMPQNMRQNSHIFGVELDSLTARIATKAYKDVNMTNQGFEQTNFADGSFDIAISNVPFEDSRITSDLRYRKLRPYIHDYFINKMIDEVRPNGLVVAITSKGTMDKKNFDLREEMASKAELLTVIRLPDDTFNGAGTSATTDILVFKKRETPLTKEFMKSEYNKHRWDEDYSENFTWVYEHSKFNHTLKQPMNAYFSNHTENILGTVETTSTLWGKDITVKSSPDIDVNTKIKEIFANIDKIYEPSKEELPIPQQTQKPEVSFIGYTIDNGELVFHNSDGSIETPDVPDKQKRRIISAINLRDITKDLFKAQRENCSNETLHELQKKLNQAYDQHNRNYGRIYKDRNLKTYFISDPSYGLLTALEIHDNNGFKGKADIFTKRTISPDVTPSHADSSVDALAISISETGTINFPYMQELTDKTYDELRQDLEFTSIYQGVDGKYYTADEFLSGNIRKKIAETQKALEDLDFQENKLFAEAIDGDGEWRKPFVHPVSSVYEQHIQDRINLIKEKGSKTVYKQEGRFNVYLKEEAITSQYIAQKVKEGEENGNDFLLFLTGAVGTLNTIEIIKKRAENDPLFVLNALKYNVDANNNNYSNLGFISECLKIMQLDAFNILSRIGDTGLTGEDYEWYSFLHDKLSKENPIQENDIETKANFLQNLQSEWETYKVDFAQKNKSLLDEKYPNVIAEIREKRNWLEKNLSALKEVCPQDIPIESIKVGLGTTFLPAQMIEEFLIEKLELSSFDRSNLNVVFEPITSEWKIEGKNIEDNAKVWQTYGTKRINALALAEKALNLRTPRITDKIEVVENGETREKSVVNPEETSKAVMKQEEIKKAFRDWIYSNKEWKKWIETYYNEHFNAIRAREYNGDMLKFPRMNPAIKLRSHQKDAIAHTIFGQNTLLAHSVGAGKTFEMIASAMESKRLGLCNKPMIVVPKHLTEQTGKEFLTLYPDANILVAGKKDFEGNKRKEMCSKIATHNWDAVIIGYTQFEKMVITPERRIAIAEQQLNELIEAKMAIQESQGNAHFSVKTLAKMIKSSQERIQKLHSEIPKDGTVFFEDLGVDRLYVDEVHNYKNLWCYTKMYNVAGVNSSSHAGKSQDLLEKIRYIQELNNGGGVIFATGTPVSNSMTELYTMMKYLQPELLKENGIYHFDAWASTFGETTTGLEIAPEGKGFREKTRFSKFNNLPELMEMYKEMADIKTPDMLNLPTPECEYVTEQIEPSEAQKEMVNQLAERADLIRRKMVKPDVDNMLNVTNEGRDLALDERNINHDLPEPADSKVKRCVKNVLQEYHNSESIKGTQLIFCDRSTPKNDGTFSVYDDIKKKLIAGGVKPEEIEFVQNANSDEKKAILFEKVRKGEVRVLLGGTNNLGTGTNVQDLLVATHDLDVPWRPSDLEQRKGRIVRVGNQNSKVKVYRYVTKGTFDSYMWQLIENKQRFISQIMTSKTSSRETEDCDEMVLSAAEIKAIATGDPLIREIMENDNELTRLKMAKSSYLENQEHTRTLLTNNYPIRLKNTKQELELSLKDKETFEKNTKTIDGVEDFSITINGKTYLDKKEAVKALGEALKLGNRFDFKGEYKGFKMSYVQDDLFGSSKLAFYHMKTYNIDLYSTPEEQLKALNRIGNTINKEAEKLKFNVDNLENAIKVAREELKKPFPHEARFKELEKRSEEIKEILAAKEKGLETEQEISKEVRINRIRKIVQNPELLPEDEIERHYLSDAAKYLDRVGEEIFLEVIDDKETLECMVRDYNYKISDAIRVIEKYSPKLPSLDYLNNIAKEYKINRRESTKLNIAAKAL